MLETTVDCCDCTVDCNGVRAILSRDTNGSADMNKYNILTCYIGMTHK